MGILGHIPKFITTIILQNAENKLQTEKNAENKLQKEKKVAENNFFYQEDNLT